MSMSDSSVSRCLINNKTTKHWAVNKVQEGDLFDISLSTESTNYQCRFTELANRRGGDDHPSELESLYAIIELVSEISRELRSVQKQKHSAISALERHQ